MPPALDLSGKRFGRLVAVERMKRPGKPDWFWLCRCSCGRTSVRRGSALQGGVAISCGCARADSLTTHGLTRRGQASPEYAAWTALQRRCDRPTHKQYSDYGGRGIRVCERWRTFAHFFADMGSRPSPDHSLDRIDNDGDYEPGNCRWATSAQQMRNQRYNRWVVVRGTRMVLADAAAMLGVNPSTVKRRARRRDSEIVLCPR